MWILYGILGVLSSVLFAYFLMRRAAEKAASIFLEVWGIERTIKGKNYLILILKLCPTESHPYAEEITKIWFRKKHKDFNQLKDLKVGDKVEFDYVLGKMSLCASDYLVRLSL